MSSSSVSDAVTVRNLAAAEEPLILDNFIFQDNVFKMGQSIDKSSMGDADNKSDLVEDDQALDFESSDSLEDCNSNINENDNEMKTILRPEFFLSSAHTTGAPESSNFNYSPSASEILNSYNAFVSDMGEKNNSNRITRSWIFDNPDYRKNLDINLLNGKDSDPNIPERVSTGEEEELEEELLIRLETPITEDKMNKYFQKLSSETFELKIFLGDFWVRTIRPLKTEIELSFTKPVFGNDISIITIRPTNTRIFKGDYFQCLQITQIEPKTTIKLNINPTLLRLYAVAEVITTTEEHLEFRRADDKKLVAKAIIPVGHILEAEIGESGNRFLEGKSVIKSAKGNVKIAEFIFSLTLDTLKEDSMEHILPNSIEISNVNKNENEQITTELIETSASTIIDTPSSDVFEMIDFGGQEADQMTSGQEIAQPMKTEIEEKSPQSMCAFVDGRGENTLIEQIRSLHDQNARQLQLLNNVQQDNLKLRKELSKAQQAVKGYTKLTELVRKLTNVSNDTILHCASSTDYIRDSSTSASSTTSLENGE